MQTESKQPHTSSLPRYHSKAGYGARRGRQTPVVQTSSLTTGQVLERRKEIEQEIVDMLKETESDFTLDHVRDVIFHEEDNDDMIHPIGYEKLSNGVKAVAMFDGSTSFDRTQDKSLTTGRGGNASELSNILELVTDAWNYFPHKALGGISPAEKLLEHHNKTKK